MTAVATLPAPELVDDSAPPAASGYRRVYRFRGGEHSHLLQRVRVQVRYVIGSTVWATLRQTYWEFFGFADPDATLRDTHDFDVMRDAWRQSVILRLVRQHRSGGNARTPAGEPWIDVRKAFLLAPGKVTDTRPTRIGDDGTFGLLTAGPDGPSRATLHVARGDGSHTALDDVAVAPNGHVIAGRGAFHEDGTDGRGFRAFEHYRYSFARTTGRLADRGAYRATMIRPIPLSRGQTP